MNRASPLPCAIRRIVHPTDFSHGSEVAFAHALKLAAGLHATLDIVHVDAHPETLRDSDFPSVHDTLIRWGLLSEGSHRKDVAGVGVRVHKSGPVGRDAVRGLLRYLGQHPAELIVLATHRRHGLARLLHQHIGEQVLELARIPTLFIPYNVGGFVDLQHGSVSLDRVVLPVARQPNPQPTVDTLSTILHSLGDVSPTTTVCHFGDEEAGAPMLNYPHNQNWQWEWLIREGEPVESILEVCEQKSADLVAMTTDGHHGFLDALRGTTTERVLHHAPCPVLVVPASPVSAEDSVWSSRIAGQRV
jgi:nucleotide-binding universal stress UspA family protein